jgi:cobaltochelatase CobN
VRHLDGQAPELYVSNLRGSRRRARGGRGQFLAKELATRNFHPGHIQGLMAEGYAGTLQVLDGVNNFAGWQSVAREVVRHDQWQEFMDVYVRDKHRLGLKTWFEQHNPHALAQSIERMLEAARLKQWDADPRSVAELKARYNDLAQRFQVRSDNATFKAICAAGLRVAAATSPRPPRLRHGPSRPSRRRRLRLFRPRRPHRRSSGLRLEQVPPRTGATAGSSLFALWRWRWRWLLLWLGWRADARALRATRPGAHEWRPVPPESLVFSCQEPCVSTT